MIAEIKFKGYTASPNDYECPDGDSAFLYNAVIEKGAVRPFPLLESKYDMPNSSDYKHLMIHKTQAGDKHIVAYKNNNDSKVWIAYLGYALTHIKATEVSSTSGIYGAEAIGNTLIVFTELGLEYMLWKGESYTCLGSKPPELTLSFGLRSELKGSDYFTYTDAALTHTSIYGPVSDEDTYERLNNTCLAQVNKFIADVHDSGKFLFPFFIRYAYRLYDETLIMHSAPILMVASTEQAPHICHNGLYTDGSNAAVSCKAVVAAAVSEIDWALSNDTLMNSPASVKASLENWKDIVKSIDVFISAPLYSYDQSGKIGNRGAAVRYYEDSRPLDYSITKFKARDGFDGAFYKKMSFYEMYMDKYGSSYNLTEGFSMLELPLREDYEETIRRCGQFYKLTSIEIENLNTVRTKIKIPKGYLSSLTNRELMSGDYDSHDKIIAKTGYAYNNRLNIANLTKEVFRGFAGGISQCYNNASETQMSLCNARIKQSNEGKEIITMTDYQELSSDVPAIFAFYPSIAAKTLVFGRGSTFINMPLSSHETIYGAYHFAGWGGAEEIVDDPPSTTPDASIRMRNAIYTSEANNPFAFLAENVNEIGNSEILGMSTAAQALSQGQFGQFPLYAFTTEGIWALEVSQTGTMINRKPLSRDICINPKSITQMDSSVLFVSSRGLMMLSGANVQCISDIIDEGSEINSSYPGISSEESVATFKDYLQNADCLYDYAGQKIFLFNPTKKYTYIYSLESKQWSISSIMIEDSVRSYPECLLIDDGVVYEVKDVPIESGIRVITRPLKLGSADTLKTIRKVIVRGNIINRSSSGGSTILQELSIYGSNDLVHWSKIASIINSHKIEGISGKPYRFFAVCLQGRLSPNNSISGCTIEYQPRLVNRLR